jgi:hypothetical protein
LPLFIQDLKVDLLDNRALRKPLVEKSEDDEKFAQAVAEQNQLLQERVIALETMMIEKGDGAVAQRIDKVEQKLDALGESVEQIKSTLASWSSALRAFK